MCMVVAHYRHKHIYGCHRRFPFAIPPHSHCAPLTRTPLITSMSPTLTLHAIDTYSNDTYTNSIDDACIGVGVPDALRKRSQPGGFTSQRTLRRCGQKISSTRCGFNQNQSCLPLSTTHTTIPSTKLKSRDDVVLLDSCTIRP